MQNLNIWQQLVTYFMNNGMYVLAQFDRHFF